jgi:hypothetical protein
MRDRDDHERRMAKDCKVGDRTLIEGSQDISSFGIDGPTNTFHSSIAIAVLDWIQPTTEC